MNKKKLTKEDKVLISTEIIQFMEIPRSTVPDLRPILDIVLKLIDDGVRLKHFEEIKKTYPGKKLTYKDYLNFFKCPLTKEYELITYEINMSLDEVDNLYSHEEIS